MPTKNGTLIKLNKNEAGLVFNALIEVSEREQVWGLDPNRGKRSRRLAFRIAKTFGQEPRTLMALRRRAREIA